uniref:Uncharacterized protein n=1 Tax=Timema bartmani TaxID=61472 RepID=A0A7R9I6E1_9NEOP|nr:unnamed protein product [Timema bartmani]
MNDLASGEEERRFLDRTNPLDRHVETMAAVAGFCDSPVPSQLFGNAAVEHMAKYGTKPEHLAKIAYKNHKHSVNNPSLPECQLGAREQELETTKDDESDVDSSLKGQQSWRDLQVTGEVGAKSSQTGEVSGAPPTTKGECATDGQKELGALFRADSPQTGKDSENSFHHDWWIPNGANGSPDQGEPSRRSPVKTTVSSTDVSDIARASKTLVNSDTFHQGVSVGKKRLAEFYSDSEDRVTRFVHVDSSCDSMDVEGLSSGPYLPLMRDESSQGSDDESEGFQTVILHRRGKAGQTRKLLGGNPND